MKSFKLTKEEATMLAQKYATPLEVISLEHIEENYNLLCKHIPRLKVFYAIKANSAKCILEKLIKLGSNFDVASAGEIRLLSKMGVSGEKMIYANPVKTIEGLIEASKVGIKRFTFDSENEIDKIKCELETARINFDMVSDNELTDYYIYEMAALNSKYRYYIKIAKQSGITVKEFDGIIFTA